MKIYFFMGRPGSGKSTIAMNFANSIEAEYISGGDIARDLSIHNPETAKALREGRMAPPEKMDRAMCRALRQALVGPESNIVVDGYPRYFQQLADIMLMSINGEFNFHTLEFIHVDAPVNSCLTRLWARGRGDEDDFTRIATYREKTESMIQWCADRTHNVHVVDNSGGVDTVEYTIERLVRTFTELP